MPLYEYYCFDCELGKEELRSIDKRNDPLCCAGCAANMELIISAPSVQIWNADRSFPNLTGRGDGSMTFANKDEYRAHLDASGVDELSTSTPVYTPHGSKIVGSWK